MNTKQEIFDYIEAEYNIGIGDLKSKCRIRDIVHARQNCIYLIRVKLGYSFPHIGKIFTMHHTSAMSAYNKVEALIKDGRMRFKGIDLSTLSTTQQLKTVDKSLNKGMKIYKKRQLAAWEINPFFMMMETNKAAEKVLNRKD